MVVFVEFDRHKFILHDAKNISSLNRAAIFKLLKLIYGHKYM